MKKSLKNYEIESLVNVVIRRIKEEKLEKYVWKKEYDEINKKLKEKGKKINKLIDEWLSEKSEFMIKNGLMMNNGSSYSNSDLGVIINNYGISRMSDKDMIVKKDINNYFLNNENYLRMKIKDELIIKSIEGEGIEKLVNDLVSKFSN